MIEFWFSSPSLPSIWWFMYLCNYLGCFRPSPHYFWIRLFLLSDVVMVRPCVSSVTPLRHISNSSLEEIIKTLDKFITIRSILSFIIYR
jgi:hypothetical protein